MYNIINRINTPFVIYGYSMAALLAIVTGVPNSALSHVYRTLSIIFAVIIVVKFAKFPSQSKAFVLLLIFYLTYSVRFIYDIYLNDVVGPRTPMVLSIFLFGGVGLSILSAYSINIDGNLKIHRSLVAYSSATLGLLVLAFPQIRTVLMDSISKSGRLNVESLNTITLGHIGVSIFTVFVVALLNQNKRLLKVYYAFGALLGLIVSIAAGSRGPVVSLIAVSLFVLFKQIRGIKAALITVVMLVLLIIGVYSIDVFLSKQLEISTLNRLLMVFNGQDINSYTSGRQELYYNSIAQFVENPLFGSSFVELVSHYYPHNLLIESYMAVGVVGGTIFALLYAYSFYCAYNLYNRSVDASMLTSLYIQKAIGIQFSGSLYFSVDFWFLFAAVLSLMYSEKFKIHASC